MSLLVDDVVALYVDPRGPYPSIVREWYDEARDARTYAGPWPVVAHPPCGAWSSLRHLHQKTDGELAPKAVVAVRRFGGVLEHPAGSRLWTYMGLPRPGKTSDAFGGRTVEVQQCDWGHVARKRTWLYLVGVRYVGELPPPREPTHWASGTHTPGQRGTTPPGIKVCSARQRRRSPRAFAEWLVSLARQANRRKSP
jgi:hypothetical protein